MLYQLSYLAPEVRPSIIAEDAEEAKDARSAETAREVCMGSARTARIEGMAVAAIATAPINDRDPAKVIAHRAG
jgi:hypothetical protein